MKNTVPKAKKIDLEKGATLFEMLDYLCSKIDFDKSYLDANAVMCMNKLFIELGKQKEKFTDEN